MPQHLGVRCTEAAALEHLSQLFYISYYIKIFVIKLSIYFYLSGKIFTHYTECVHVPFLAESESLDCRPPGQAMDDPDHNGVGYLRSSQGETYRSRGQLQRHHTIQTCDDAYVSKSVRYRQTENTLLLKNRPRNEIKF